MFYILTSRKYGVATIWLVATLGSKSSLKKVNRKAILEVDVSKACEIIIAPEAPMALRLQSNLLYGVSRVYSQQCGYVLTDAQTAQNHMRALLSVVRTAELDPEAGRARPEALLLEDDPTFLPDLAFVPLDFDLSRLEASLSGGSQASKSLSPHTARTTPLSDHAGLILPTSDTGGVGDIGDFGFGGSPLGEGDLRRFDDDGVLPEADFTFDEEGNLLDLSQVRAASAALQRATPRPRSVQGSEAPASLRARSILEPVPQGDDVHTQPMDVDLPSVGDDYDILPDAPPFETPPRPEAHHSPSARVSEEDEISSSVAAPQRRRKAPKILSIDEATQLRNSDLARWNNEYAENMAVATRHKMNHKAPLQAKLNAEEWILGVGLGGVGRGIGNSNVNSPLDIFSGASLYKALTGDNLTTIGQKREHDATIADEEDVERRRVRPRTEKLEEELGRGAGETFDDHDDFVGVEDDIEMPREAGEPLADESTVMPWNVAAFQRGSSVGRGRAGSLAAVPSSAVGLSSIGGPLQGLAGPAGSVSQRGPRFVSASPLAGRSLPLAVGPGVPTSDTGGEGGDFGLGAELPEDVDQDAFELYGPAAGVDTQTAESSRWQRTVLDAESFKFLEFIEKGIEKVKGGEEETDTVLFEEVLPPADYSYVVAAQGLLHVLSLVTKGLITAKQPEPFAAIELKVLPTVDTI
ncbi:hypothetical protein NA57DRAFT_76913 [Rhizodiscina lignyota]|uniref:Rad21/Rec8-like protein N-terminal domain-containing protein n=1 Tax=Rhizodiscina lignyota TaxID=1504668 RepID=A0A9P4IDP2_9PEZI|nr:hypothetical protein NA57DRAFT_76913 [Rhizodiscina lignyota]